MKTGAILAAAALSLLCLEPARAATAPCVTRAEIRGLVGFAAPSLLRRVQSECGSSLAADGPLPGRLPDLIAAYDGAKQASWPMAKAAFFKLGDSKDAKSLKGFTDATLRPLVDEALTQQMTLSLSPGSCADVEDVVATLAPMPADSLADLAAVVLSVAARKDGKMCSCPRDGA
jgi:hypothetical protein